MSPPASPPLRVFEVHEHQDGLDYDAGAILRHCYPQTSPTPIANMPFPPLRKLRSPPAEQMDKVVGSTPPTHRFSSKQLFYRHEPDCDNPTEGPLGTEPHNYSGPSFETLVERRQWTGMTVECLVSAGYNYMFDVLQDERSLPLEQKPSTPRLWFEAMCIALSIILDELMAEDIPSHEVHLRLMLGKGATSIVFVQIACLIRLRFDRQLDTWSLWARSQTQHRYKQAIAYQQLVASEVDATRRWVLASGGDKDSVDVASITQRILQEGNISVHKDPFYYNPWEQEEFARIKAEREARRTAKTRGTTTPPAQMEEHLQDPRDGSQVSASAFETPAPPFGIGNIPSTAPDTQLLSPSTHGPAARRAPGVFGSSVWRPTSHSSLSAALGGADEPTSGVAQGVDEGGLGGAWDEGSGGAAGQGAEDLEGAMEHLVMEDADSASKDSESRGE